MRKGKKYQLPIISLFLLFLFCFPAYAGSINGNEQSVISVAQGQFEYNGETYRAKQEYVGALIGYLQRDDVDLSAADAQAAISQIYANVQTGVEAGYLEKVGGASGPGAESNGGENGGENGSGNSGGGGDAAPPPSDGAATSSGNQGDNQKPQQDNRVQGQSGDVAGQSEGSPDNQRPENEAYPDETSPEGENALEGNMGLEGMASSKALTQQKQEREVEKPEEIRILESIAQSGEFTGTADLPLDLSSETSSENSLKSSLNSRLKLSQESSLELQESSPELQESSPESQEPGRGTMEDRLFPFAYQTVLLYVLSSLLGVSVILGIVIFTKHLYRYHQRSKNLRKAARSIAGVNLAAATFILLFTASLGLGVLRDTVFQKSIEETGYYENVYDDFVKKNVSTFDFLKIPEEVFKNAVSYEQISMSARQQMENDLHRGTYQVNVSVFSNRIKNRVRDYIRDQELPMTQSGRKGLDMICQYLESEYTALLHWNYALLWGGWHEDFMVALRWLLPMSLLLFLVSHLIIISTHHFKHRGIRQCGFSIGAGAAVYLIFNIATKFITEGKGAQGETYVDLFLFYFLRRGMQIGLLIGLVGICFALGYLALAKATKEGVK